MQSPKSLAVGYTQRCGLWLALWISCYSNPLPQKGTKKNKLVHGMAFHSVCIYIHISIEQYYRYGYNTPKAKCNHRYQKHTHIHTQKHCIPDPRTGEDETVFGGRVSTHLVLYGVPFIHALRSLWLVWFL